jgi:uncharacterized protein YegL
MRNDLTDIIVVLDRSGSMQACREEAENGLNHFIEDQKQQPGETLFTLCQFDTEYEFIYQGVPIRDVPHCALVPRGMTALLDAVGRAINETGERLSKMAEADRPGLVVFVILTDGHENSSHEFKKDQIKAMIKEQQERYSWQFTFLGANQDAFAEAAGLGIAQQAAVNFVQAKAEQAFNVVSRSVSRSRESWLTGQSKSIAYTDEERSSVQ